MNDIKIQEALPHYMRLHCGNANAAYHQDYIRGLVELYRFVNKPDGVGVEIGAWSGESAEVAAQCLRLLYCIDPWIGQEGNECLFDARMQIYPNVRKLKMASYLASQRFHNQSLDIVYIDGMHDAGNVKLDISAWLPKIKPGGWLAGHDYDDHEKHAGVVQAVHELLGTPPYRFEDASWCFPVGMESW